MKKRVIARTMISKYLTETDNERAFYVGLRFVLALVKSKHRHYKNYTKPEGKGWTQEKEFDNNDPLIRKIIGSELMKLALELNLFIRIITTV